MSFLDDYLLYNENNECQKSYHTWSALVLLAAASGRRVWKDFDYFCVYPNLYVCLVGRQGNRKSTAKDIARDMFEEAFSDYPQCASVQSKEDIIKFMASPACLRAMDIGGAPVEYRPFVMFINELKNFLSINPGGMIDFLTDIYDRKHFDASTIKRGLEVIVNPCVNILACETPQWIIDKLKANIITGGFSRRMIYVYEVEEGPRIAFPKATDEGKKARQRCIEHLRKVSTISGEFEWTPDGKAFYQKWYETYVTPADEAMAGYYRSKNMQLLKVAMGLALGEPEPQLLFTRPFLFKSLEMLTRLEANMPLLSIAAGRNELAVPQQRILALLRDNGGVMRAKQLKILLDKDVDPREQWSLLQHLERETEQIRQIVVVRNGNDFKEIWLAERFIEGVQSGELISKEGKVHYKNGA